MKDFKNKRKGQEVTEEVKKEVIKQKKENFGGKGEERPNLRLVESEEEVEKKIGLKEVIVLISIVVVVFLAGMATEAVIIKSKYQYIEKSLEQEVPDKYNDYYDWGVIQMRQILSLKEDEIAFYKSDDITDEQMKELVEAYLNIINLSLSEENYRRGLKDFLVADSYRQIAKYYRELIPEEKYESFVKIVNSNLYQTIDCENNIQIVIDYGRDLIQEYIGDPDEILVSTEWRVFTGMPEK